MVCPVKEFVPFLPSVADAKRQAEHNAEEVAMNSVFSRSLATPAAEAEKTIMEFGKLWNELQNMRRGTPAVEEDDDEDEEATKPKAKG